MSKAPIAITGVWARTRGSGNHKRIEVLVEVAGAWKLVQSHPFGHQDVEVSHITEPLGIAGPPEDRL